MIPLGIADLLNRRVESWTNYTTLRDAWFWCRQHEKAHKVGEPCQCDCDFVDGICTNPLIDRFLSPCIDIGPFMSEREANRLAEVVHLYAPGKAEGGYDLRRPLGMEVET